MATYPDAGSGGSVYTGRTGSGTGDTAAGGREGIGAWWNRRSTAEQVAIGAAALAVVGLGVYLIVR